MLLLCVLLFFFLSRPHAGANPLHGGEDSLSGFSKNYMPAYSPSDEIVRHTAFTLCYCEEEEQAKWLQWLSVYKPPKTYHR